MIITKGITCLVEEFTYNNIHYILNSHFQNENLLAYVELYEKNIHGDISPIFISNSEEYISEIYDIAENKILTHSFYTLYTSVNKIFYNIELLINLVTEEISAVSIYSGNCLVNLESDLALAILAECPKAINPSIH